MENTQEFQWISVKPFVHFVYMKMQTGSMLKQWAQCNEMNLKLDWPERINNGARWKYSSEYGEEKEQFCCCIN